MSAALNRQVVRELARLEGAGLIDARQASAIAERYPVAAWNGIALVRAFTVIGAMSASAGAVILASELANAIRLLEAALGLAVVVLIAAGRWAAAEKDMPRTGAGLEFAGGFALQGLVTVLAIDFSTGSGNWPALAGIQAILLLGLAYALGNRLVLGHACATAFVWFGGHTGYASGWGMYWLGMTYPLRFLAAGFVTLGVAWLHAERIPTYQAFSRVYGHFGSLCVHLSLWFLSVFGVFGGVETIRWNNTGERLLFTLLWAAVASGFMLAGARGGIQLLRSYGMVFLGINTYTFYFQFIVANSAGAWWLHLLATGGSLLWLGSRVERGLRAASRPGLPG